MTVRIVTLTLNPAVDIACTAAAVRPTHKIRTTDERYDPGGGGINVARVVHVLGGDTCALIMTGDFSGGLIEEMLADAGVAWQRLPIAGRSRISLAVHDRETGLEYRFVPEGPVVSEAEWRAALAVLGAVEADWVVASGSLPRGMPEDFYAQAARIAASRGQKFALDTSGASLRHGVGAGVSLLKLSETEFASLIGHTPGDAQAQELAIAALIREGAAEMIAVSLGAEGAVLANADGVWRRPALPVQVRSSVGAGDSFLAGLVFGLGCGMAPGDALDIGMAAGAAAVSAYGTAQVRREDVEAFHPLPPVA